MERPGIPVILLLDREASKERNTVRDWFENSRFSVCEASDIFEALSEMSDFTLPARPDVVLLGGDSCEDDLPLVREIVDPESGQGPPILALSSRRSDRSPQSGDWYYRGDLSQVASRLDTLIPSSTSQ